MAEMTQEELIKLLAGAIAPKAGIIGGGSSVSPSFWGLRGGGMTSAQQQYNQDKAMEQSERNARANAMMQYANMISADKATKESIDKENELKREQLWNESKTAQVGDFNQKYGNLEKLMMDYENLGDDTSNNAKRLELQKAIENGVLDLKNYAPTIYDLYDGREMPTYLKGRLDKYKEWSAPWKVEKPTTKVVDEPQPKNVEVDRINGVFADGYTWSVPTNSKEAKASIDEVDGLIKDLENNADAFGGKESDEYKNKKDALEQRKTDLEKSKKDFAASELKARRDSFNKKFPIKWKMPEPTDKTTEGLKAHYNKYKKEVEDLAKKAGLVVSWDSDTIVGISEK